MFILLVPMIISILNLKALNAHATITLVIELVRYSFLLSTLSLARLCDCPFQGHYYWPVADSQDFGRQFGRRGEGKQNCIYIIQCKQTERRRLGWGNQGISLFPGAQQP